MKITRWIFAVLLLPLLGCAAEAPRDMSEQRDLLIDATATVQRLQSDPEFPELRDYIQKSKAVLVIPTMMRAGFMLGAEHGTGVLLARTSQGGAGVAPAPVQGVEVEDLQNKSTNKPAQTWKVASAPVNITTSGGWGNPVFYRLTGGSAGLQIGAQSAEIIITIMTDKGLQGFLNNSVKLGADASLAVGPMGKNVAAGTTMTPPAADMYTFGQTVGLYGGATLSGAMLYENKEWNLMAYGNASNPRDVMMRADGPLSEADALRSALDR